jgi:hypothetical protein
MALQINDAMQIVVGPVVTRKGGYAFDCWTPEEGLSRGYAYARVEDAHYARNVEIRSHQNGHSDHMIACNTDFRRCPDVVECRGERTMFGG